MQSLRVHCGGLFGNNRAHMLGQTIHSGSLKHSRLAGAGVYSGAVEGMFRQTRNMLGYLGDDWR